MRFDKKVAIVTGAGQGIGKEVVKIFASEGAIVVMNDINSNHLESSSKDLIGIGSVVPYKADAADIDQVQNMVNHIINENGSIDILVNNVGGVTETEKTLEQTTLDYWRDTIELNLTSHFIACQAVVPIMKKQGYGRIVNVSSGVGVRPTPRDALPYSVAKAGVIGLTKYLAMELGHLGITVNAVCPGDTMTEKTYELINKGWWPESEEDLLKRHSQYPLGRPAKANEPASAIAFLASDDARYITGETMLVLGGVYMHK